MRQRASVPFNRKTTLRSRCQSEFMPILSTSMLDEKYWRTVRLDG